MENGNQNTIDFKIVFDKIKANKRLMTKVLCTTFVLACVYIFPQPRYYDSSVMLAPEVVDLSVGGNLSSLASNFGFDLGGGGQDAIYPLLYPDLMQSKQFLVSLFDIKVKTADGAVDCDLHTYLLKHQKEAFYEYPKTWIRQKIKEFKTSGKPTAVKKDETINPFRLSESDMILTETLESMIRCSVNKKTDVITIQVRTQDPLVSATIADSVSTRLQIAITDYRTSKARNDVEYYSRLSQDSKDEYERAVKKFCQYSESHNNATRQSYISQRDKLENEMNMRYEIYQAMHSQLQSAQAKLQEKTPAFTVLQCSTVPIKPAGPQRMIFVLAMLIFSTGCTILYIGRDEFKKVFAAH